MSKIELIPDLEMIKRQPWVVPGVLLLKQVVTMTCPPGCSPAGPTAKEIRHTIALKLRRGFRVMSIDA